MNLNLVKWQSIFNKRNVKNDFNLIKESVKKILENFTFPSITVVGTNGKGSVTEMLSDAFQKAGYKVGKFTSPHFVSPTERIMINSKEIPEDEFWQIYESLLSKGIIHDSYSFFTILFLVMLSYFKKEKVTFAIIEAGIGGMFDITRVLESKWNVLTSISYDHTEMLGSSLKEIALQKVGIVSNNQKFFAPSKCKKYKKIFSKYLSEKNSILKFVSNKGKSYKEQNRNLVRNFLKQEFNLEYSSLKDAPYRDSIINRGNFISVFSVAHNSEGFKNTNKYLKKENIQYTNVLLMVQTRKDVSKVGKIFKGKNIYFYSPNDDFHKFEDKGFTSVSSIENFYNNQKASTLYIGSFKLIGEIVCLKNI